MSASTPKFSRFPAAVDLRGNTNTNIALIAAIAAERGRRRDGTVVDSHVSLFAAMFSGNANHCWRTVRNWGNTALSQAVRVIKNPDGSQRFTLAGGRFIKFPTWALTSGVLSRVAIVALLGLCSGLQYKDATRAVTMTRTSLHNRTGLGSRSVSKGLDELEEAGVITKSYQFSKCGRKAASTYTINWERGAREGTMEGAREGTTATAREGTNTSEDLFSEDYSSDPPPPHATKTDQAQHLVEGEELVTTSNTISPVQDDVPSTRLLTALAHRQGAWAPLLAGAQITRRDHQRITKALRGINPDQAASELDAITTPQSLLGVRRPISVMPSRLEEITRRVLTKTPQRTLKPAQRLKELELCGEIAAGERPGTLDDWQHLIDELA